MNNKPLVSSNEGCHNWKLSMYTVKPHDIREAVWYNRCRSCAYYSNPGVKAGQCLHDPPKAVEETVPTSRKNRYIHLPTAINAIQFTGTKENEEEIREFISDKLDHFEEPQGYHIPALVIVRKDGNEYCLEEGDWVIRTDNGCVYMCKKDSFHKHYQRMPL